MPHEVRHGQGSHWRLHSLANHIPYLGILIIATLALAIINTPLPPQWLMGWDNLNPELNIWLNIQRAFVSVWQEYQGVGLLAGMGHAADLPRLLLFIPLSYFVPLSFLRIIWVFNMLCMGVVGVYIILKRLLLPSLFPAFSIPLRNTTALLGGLFALTNLATLQMFHTPFEPFVTHFGFLPWLLFVAIRLIQQPTKRTIIWFSLLSFFSAPQGYVQTIFAVYLLALGAVSLVHVFHFKKEVFGRIVLIWVITFTTNAFWLLPSVYFFSKNVTVTVNAKINQMSTEEVYLRNQAVGRALDTAQLKGFWFDTFDFNPNKRVIGPIFGFWRQSADTMVTSSVLLFLFSVVLIGGITCCIRKKHLWLVLLFLFTFTVLTMSTPPFSWINDLLNRIPFWHQAYRIRFTKFSLLASISYSLLFAIGCAQILNFLSSRARLLKILLTSLCCTAMLIVAKPAFLGQLFYPVITVTMPNDFEKLSAFLQTKEPGRIANLPQHSYWGWQYTDWGYTGWGYLWYLVEHPILDRAFDVWSPKNENYYWELSRALYAKDIVGLSSIFQKYDVKYVLLDEHIISPNNNRALYIDEIKNLLRMIPTVQQVGVFGKLTLFENKNNHTQSFVSLNPILPVISPPYRWTDNDVAYQELGDYISVQDGFRIKPGMTSVQYPFRSLFTKRAVDEREFNIKEDNYSIALSSTSASDSASIDKRNALVFEATTSGELAAAAVIPCGLLNNGTASASNESGGFLRFQSKNQRNCLSFGAPDLTHANGYLVTVESRHVTGRPLLFSLINETAKHVELETYLESAKFKVQSSKFESIKGVRPLGEERPDPFWQTDYFILPPLAPDGLGYSVYLSNDAIGSDETINDIKSVRFYKLPYNDLVHMRSIKSDLSLNNEATKQLSNAIVVDHPNPAYYKIMMDNGQETINKQSQTGTLILNQAYHEGWKAWTINTNNPIIQLSNEPIKRKLFELFPFLFGTEIKEHVMVNNWSNGWIVNKSQITNPNVQCEKTSSFGHCDLELVIFFLPQLLEWMGFLLLPVPFLLLIVRKRA